MRDENLAMWLLEVVIFALVAQMIIHSGAINKLQEEYEGGVLHGLNCTLIPSACHFNCTRGNRTVKLYSMLLWDGQYSDLVRRYNCTVRYCTDEKLLVCR